MDTSGPPLNGTDLIAPQKTSYNESGLTNGTTYFVVGAAGTHRLADGRVEALLGA